MTTPHRVGQVAKATLLVADRLEAWGLTDPHERAEWLIERLMTDLGWTPPRDLTDTPPLSGPGSDLDGPGYREWSAARAALAERRAKP